MHLLDLSAEVKKGVQEAGLVGYRFNTVGVSDGMSNGTSGMSYSLQSRDLIADSIETVSLLNLFGKFILIFFFFLERLWVVNGMMPISLFPVVIKTCLVS